MKVRHALGHTPASALLEGGPPLRVVRMRLTHPTFSSAVLYRADGEANVDSVDDPVVATACALEPFKMEA